MNGTSEDIAMLLAGLEVEGIAELKRMVDSYRLLKRLTDDARDLIRFPSFDLLVGAFAAAENEDDVTAARLRQLTVGRPDLGPGWREDSSEELFYSAAWLDADETLDSEASRGAAERRPHGREGQLQQ